MSNDLFTGKWNGQYTLGDTYSEDMKGISRPFSIDMTYLDGIISGTCVDEGIENIFTEPATINGFIEDNFISFIKKYPCHWETDDKGNIRKDLELPSLEIHYSGQFDQNMFRGNWEMEMLFKDDNGYDFEYVFTGTWTMLRS